MIIEWKGITIELLNVEVHRERTRIGTKYTITGQLPDQEVETKEK